LQAELSKYKAHLKNMTGVNEKKLWDAMKENDTLKQNLKNVSEKAVQIK
jgi:hypothetical protein